MAFFKSLPIQIDDPRKNFFITSKYGERRGNEIHNGVDIRAAYNTQVFSVLDGRVIAAGRLNNICGNGVVIAHQVDGKDAYTTTYCHLANEIPKVQVNSTVRAGDQIGRVGTSGRSNAAHLHFVLREVVNTADPELGGGDDIPINPEGYLLGLVNSIEFNSGASQTRLQNQQQYINGISPYISSLESFHPKIQYELTRRSLASETANVYMPFVKLTSLTRILKEDLPEGVSTAWCPSLGIHGESSQTFEDIYTTRNNRSTIGYAVTKDNEQNNTRVIVRDAKNDAKNIPIPGIIKVSAERGTAGPMGVRGGLFKADLSILAYSVGQVDALLRYFMRPATRVVLEFGRKSTSTFENKRTFTPYNWKQEESVIVKEFTDLINDAEAQQRFINQYIYGNYGNYEIFIGYVVKFNLKYNKDNTYVIDLTIHSVQQFELPTKHTGVKSLCVDAAKNCKVMDVHEYFSDSYSWKENSFSNLIDTALQSSAAKEYIVRISKDDPSDANNTDGSGPSTQAGTRENEYFVTWNFFIQEILNNPLNGIASILGDNEQMRNLIKLGLPRTTRLPLPNDKYGLVANEVGYHPNLRSTTPSVMIINNRVAQTAYENSFDKQIYESAVKKIEEENKKNNLTAPETPQQTSVYDAIYNGVVFTNHLGSEQEAGAGWLQEGVWLNTAAIKRAFTGTDTITSALSMLLNMMNSATEGYWNLQLYSTDVSNPGMHIIDMGLAKPISPSEQNATAAPEFPVPQVLDSITDINELEYQISKDKPDTPKYLYVFNKKTTIFPEDDIGSELIDMNIEFNLPQVIAVQAIAGVGGPAQKSLLQSIDIPELNKISLIADELFNPCETDINKICAEDDTSCINSDQQADIENEIALLKKQLESLPIGLSLPGRSLVLSLEEKKRELSELIVEKQSLITTNIVNQNPNVVGTLREYSDLGTAIQLAELNPSSMMRKMNLDSENDVTEGRITPKAHAFNSSNLTKTIVDVTLPGIGGINLFQSFLVDRAPSILERGFYVVTKIAHEFSSQSGWITKVQGRFRFKPDKKQNGSVYDLCANGGNSTGGAGRNLGDAARRILGQPGTQPNQVIVGPPARTGEAQLEAAAQDLRNAILNNSVFPNATEADKRRYIQEVNEKLMDTIVRYRNGTALNILLNELRLPSAEPKPIVFGDTIQTRTVPILP